ncbi:MAG: hypothetical protein WBW34_10585, partial [Nitrososphaeraceae archaeon]
MLYKSAERERISFAKLCPTIPNPTIIRRNLDSDLVNFAIYLIYSLFWCFYNAESPVSLVPIW